jgi:hypothetical protein
MSCSCGCHSGIHRALVTYSNAATGEIKVKIPTVLGVESEVSISTIGRSPHSGLWTVPDAGQQIVVSSDDANMTNVFWVQTDPTGHNYAVFYSTQDQYRNLTVSESIVTYNNQHITKNIKLLNNKTILFEQAGVYRIEYNIQWGNSDSKVHDAMVWVKRDGVSLYNTAAFITIPESHGGVEGKITSSRTYVDNLNKGSTYEFAWTSQDITAHIHYSELDYAWVPLDAPNGASVIVSITQVV